jgi:hypothetical protein
MDKSLVGSVLFVVSLSLFVFAEAVETGEEPVVAESANVAPWIGKYPMSGFVRVRTAKTVGKDHLSFSLKMQYCDYDEYRDAAGCYCDLAGEECNKKSSSVLTAKYGWAKDHHLAFGIPYLRNHSDFQGKVLETSGIGNVFVFEKWNLIKESNRVPGVAFDVWYYFPTGDTERKIGTDDYAWKLTTEISKAWKDFSVHINPGYRFSEERDCDVIEGNAMIVFTPLETFWPAVEYNYTYQEGAGRCNDIVPGFIWKFAPAATFKLGAVINADSTMKFRDEVGVVAKLFYRF